MRFKAGDIVKMSMCGSWWSGELTIVKEDGMCKFLSDHGDGPNYDYYKEDEFTKITQEEREELIDLSHRI